MTRRALPAIVVIIAALAAIVVVGRESVEPTTPVFAEERGTWMPAVGVSGSLTGSWFCPGVPATGEAGVGGDVVVSNRDGSQLTGRYTILTPDGVASERSFTVDAWSQTRIDVGATLAEPVPFASVVVEIEGGGGLVEQRAVHPAGESVAACANDTSETWYLADGFTLGGSTETLVLTNPFEETVRASLRFSTAEREAQPGQFRGFIVPPRSVRVIPIAELGARDEPVIATSIEVNAGRLVVGRAQHYVGGGRLGYDVSLAAPALRDQWWFALGERQDGVSETYSIYNPTDDDVEVTVFFGGLPIGSGVEDLDPIPVPPRRVVIFDPYADDGATFSAEDGDDGATADDGAFDSVFGSGGVIPDGPHAAVFSTLAQPSIVVERIMTVPTESSITTTINLGAPPRPDGFVSTTWHMGIGPRNATPEALVVWNIDQAPATIDVSAVGPAGPTPVPSLTGLTAPPGETFRIDLTDPDVIGQELIIETSNRVFVERLLPRGNGLDGRSASWLLPAT
ncbi:MAG: DUF5719 family protein [Actinomycetota bacterium]